MTDIELILKLPKQEQVAIMEAIQNNLDDFDNEEALSDDHISFIKDRIASIENSSQKTYTWQQMKDELKSRWSTQ